MQTISKTSCHGRNQYRCTSMQTSPHVANLFLSRDLPLDPWAADGEDQGRHKSGGRQSDRHGHSPLMCAASRSSRTSLGSGREYGATAWWPPSIRDPEEPLNRPIRTQGCGRLRTKIKSRPPRKAYQQGTRVQTRVDWDTAAQFWHSRPAFGPSSATHR